MPKVSGVPYDVKLEGFEEFNPLDHIKTKEQLDEYVAGLKSSSVELKETGASKVFVAGYAISGDKKIIEFARLVEQELSK
jgi:3-keto-L-gulonate-6-phosphate decarboxylase